MPSAAHSLQVQGYHTDLESDVSHPTATFSCMCKRRPELYIFWKSTLKTNYNDEKNNCVSYRVA